MAAKVTERDGYETPALADYGTIEQWTQGVRAQFIEISIVLFPPD